MASTRALLIHLKLPSWTTQPMVEEAWDTVIGPALDAVIDSGNPVGLVLAGRLVETAPEMSDERMIALRTALSLGRIELVATAMHEPVLGTLPDHDVIGQLRSHSTLLRRTLGERPTGGWVPHGSWDRKIPFALQKVGLGWTTIDSRALENQGCPRAAVLSVERHGRSIAVLPGRPLTPRAWTGLAVIEVRTPEDVRVLTAALPRTNGLPSQLIGRNRARAYLASDEGWAQVLLQRPAADRLHKRSLGVSRLVGKMAKAVERTKHVEGGADPRTLEQVRRYLYRAQSAEALVPPNEEEHLVGAYRDRAWRDLIRAEALAMDALGFGLPSIREVDEDCDGAPETRVVTQDWAVAIAPQQEAALIEISHRPSASNLVAAGVPFGFRERWNEGAPVALDWALVTADRVDAGVEVKALADTALGDVAVQVLKRVHIPEHGPLQVQLEVRTGGGGAARGHLATECFLNLGGPRLDGDQEAAVSVEVAGGREPLDEEIDLPGLDAVGICGWRTRVDLAIDPPGRVTIEPMEQGAARVVVRWPVDLLTGDVARCAVELLPRKVVHG